MAEQTGNQIQTPEVGERLRTLRKSKGYSIRSLAEKAGLSPNTISLIENSSTSPTVATLLTIANVLEVPLAAFFMQDEQEEEVMLIRSQDREKRVMPGVKVSVFPESVLDQRVHILHFSIAPGGGSGAEEMIHEGEELVLCLQGELDYIVNHRIYHLKEQDSLAFRPNLPHAWINRSEAETHFLVMITTENDLSFRAHMNPTP